MSNNKFEALVSDDSDSEDLVNSQQLEVIAYCIYMPSGFVLSLDTHVTTCRWSRSPSPPWLCRRVITASSPSIVSGTAGGVPASRVITLTRISS